MNVQLITYDELKINNKEFDIATNVLVDLDELIKTWRIVRRDKRKRVKTRLPAQKTFYYGCMRLYEILV